MLLTKRTETFDKWLNALRDRMGRLRILARLTRIEAGNFGDSRHVGENVFELRVDHGPGYRVYFTRRGPVVVILLCGGDKSSQVADIATAQRLAREMKEY
ncbi:type II toxin-antitoxin system RelE/ParE family toxin [Ramlibacter albus]|uniref:Type II toxin-antitoxin system RelE/ParE family toxin n=1 Tax=Ramlibacter albus TaxID=2079448 RepID=A0A923MB32_9BURK|nr:type II toxin-antitoxin system RelE/ParE family toxin [Ramlibacter albus]MBC5766064.1 type II toxin-antitoxin system RelE/ParE family toxin [Ramlibacter albus]